MTYYFTKTAVNPRPARKYSALCWSMRSVGTSLATCGLKKILEISTAVKKFL